MPGVKRQHAEDAAGAPDSLHPSRKRRLDYSQANADISATLNELADEIPAVRLEAARKLVTRLSAHGEEQLQLLEYALTRLIKGLCSDRKAARLGFSVALVEALRIAFDQKDRAPTKFSTLRSLVDNVIILTRPETKATGQERRGFLLGRRSAYQAILQSNALQHASEHEARHVFDALADLAAEKQWLRSECLAVLCEFLNASNGRQLGDQNARQLIDSWESNGLLKTAEGVALWISVRETFPQSKLPKGTWHHNNPLSSQDRPQLSKLMLKDAVDSGDVDENMRLKKGGARQATPSAAWSIVLSHLYTESKTAEFASFWSDCVAKPMFSPASSTERKALGLQIFSQALATAPTILLEHVVHPNIVHCILDQRAKSDRFLFEASKLPLNQMSARGKRDAASAPPLVKQLVSFMSGKHDQLTKKTIEALIAQADIAGLTDIALTLVKLCWMPGTADASQAEQKRRMLADILLTLVRTHRSDAKRLFIESPKNGLTLAPWLDHSLEQLVKLGYQTADSSSSPSISESSQSVFRQRLMSCLSNLLDQPLEQAALVSSAAVTSLYAARKHLILELNDEAIQTLKEARKVGKSSAEKARVEAGSQATVHRAFQLLLALSMLEVYNREPESVGVLEDVITHYKSSQEDDDSSVNLVELLLSFASKESGLFRKLAEQVFSAFAPNITHDGLLPMIEVLLQKEGLSGQQELFERHDDDEALENGESDDEGVDVESDSDVELVNGAIVQGNGRANGGSDAEADSDSSSSGDEESEEAEGSDEEDEEAAFDRKLADALGTAGMGEDSDEHGSDMDDEQMMALDAHLSTIFKERGTGSSKKQENKDAKENVVHFKTRVLDLLKRYVESQHANSAALGLILPLATLVRTTSSKAVAEKALNGVLKPYFDACTKHKSLPQPEKHEDCLETLKAVHSEMKLGGSKLHATACSRASLFLTRVLVALDATYFDAIADSYAGLQKEWYRNPKSKIHGSIFTDWTSWVLSTRKAHA